MGITTLGRERATNPFLAQLGVSARHPGPARHVRRAGRAGAPRATRRGQARGSSSAPATSGSRRRRSRRPSCSRAASASRPTSCRRRCTRSTTARATQHHAAPGGHRAGLPRLPRARHAQAPAAGEALVPVELLPPRAPAGGPLPPVLADRRRRRSAPTTRPSTPSRSCCSPSCSRRSASRGAPAADRLARHARTRARAYREELQAYLRAHEAELAQEVVARIDLNPLRAFDSDHPGTQRGHGAARRCCSTASTTTTASTSRRCARCSTPAGIAYEVDPTLVRGLDYYTRTVFEFTSDALGAQSGVGGGGRYDGLIEQIGGPPTPGIGWASRRRADPARRRRRSRPPSRRSTCSSPTRGPSSARRRSGSPPTRAAPGHAQTRARRPLAQGPAQAGRPRAAPATLRSSATRAPR